MRPESISLIRIPRSASVTNAVHFGTTEKEIYFLRGGLSAHLFSLFHFPWLIKFYFFFYFRLLPLVVSIYDFGAQSENFSSKSPRITLPPLNFLQRTAMACITLVHFGITEEEMYFLRGGLSAHLFSLFRFP